MERIVRFWVTSGTAHRRRAQEVGYVCRISKIGNLQQLVITDPGSGKVGLSLARGSGVAACFIEFGESVVRPAVGWRAGERALELLLGFAVASRLQQGGGKGLADRVVPIWWLGVGQGVLHRGRAFKPNDGGAVVAMGWRNAGEDRGLRYAKPLVRRKVCFLAQLEFCGGL